jgi:hypothetical protein
MDAEAGPIDFEGITVVQCIVSVRHSRVLCKA